MALETLPQNLTRAGAERLVELLSVVVARQKELREGWLRSPPYSSWRPAPAAPNPAVYGRLGSRISPMGCLSSLTGGDSSVVGGFHSHASPPLTEIPSRIHAVSVSHWDSVPVRTTQAGEGPR